MIFILISEPLTITLKENLLCTDTKLYHMRCV